MSKSILSDDLDRVDLDPGHYVKNSSLQNSLAQAILSNYPLSPFAHILDVGCGDGRITAGLAGRANQGTVIGVDPSPGMIEFAVRSFPKEEFPNLDFQIGMAEDIAFSQQFDLVVAFSCFHWFKNPKKAICQLSASLKQGGEILVLTYPKESPYYRYLQQALKHYPEYLPRSSSTTMLSSNEYEEYFSCHQLEITYFERQHLFASYHHLEELKEYIQGWLSSYVPLPEHLHSSYLEDVCHAVASDSSTIHGEKIRIPYTALVIKARKK